MQLIFSRSHAATGPISQDALPAVYRHPTATRPGRIRLRTNFVTTLDGSISGPDGRSGSINTASDHHVFAVHRALADVVLVGAGTVRAEGYRAVDLASWQRDLRVAEGQAPHPVLVIISGSGDVDPSVARPADGQPGGAVLIVTAGSADEASLAALRDAGVEVVRQPGGTVDLTAMAALLADRGLTRVLCEGGPRLHRDLLAADLVDEVSLTLSPMMVAGPGLRSTSGPGLPDPRHFVLQHALHADDETLFTHYVRRD